MHPVPFQYLKPTSLAEAFGFINEYGDDLKILAGGQSLIPMMNLRMARPAYVMDISRIAEFQGVESKAGRLSIGALTRHSTITAHTEISTVAPLLCEGAGYIGNIRVRHRGTIGGSLAHADPAAELGAVAVALKAEIEVISSTDTRIIPAADFFVSIMTTSLSEGEMIARVHFPSAGPRTGARFVELVRRAGDFAIVGAGAQVTLESDNLTIKSVGLGLIGVANTPICPTAVEAALRGRAGTPENLAAASQEVIGSIDPMDDLSASAKYRQTIAPVMVRRALEEAITRAQSQLAAEGR
jgi:carbon-monoxide dehydrogenase medium subunit